MGLFQQQMSPNLSSFTAEQKKTVFATDRGWVQLNGKGNEEVICAIANLLVNFNYNWYWFKQL